MAKKRVYEIAKEKGVSNKELLWVLEKLEIETKSHMSAIENETLGKIDEYYKKIEGDHKSDALEKPERKIEDKILNNINKEKSKVSKEEVTSFEVKRDAKAPVPARKNHVEKKAKVETTPKKISVKNATEVNVSSEKNKKSLLDGEKVSTTEAGEAIVPKKFKENMDTFNKGKQKFKNTKGQNRYGRNQRRFGKFKNKDSVKIPEVLVKKISVGEEIQVKDLAMRMQKTTGEVIKKLMALGIMATLNQYVDYDTAVLIAGEFGINDVEFKTIKRQTELDIIEDQEEALLPRPPIITVMGHVDHGKTSLLDAIRKTDVIATEAGGITQHIGAYQVHSGSGKITFIDTPGHAAFTSMRARGAMITDIAILVVAADDGVMPQTIEAIDHAKAAGVPIIVAINKIDKPGADAEKIMQQLAEHKLVPEAWGGDTIYVPVSAKKRENIDKLLEMILLVSELEDLKANPNRLAEGYVLEAELDKEKGTMATLIVNKGTLRVGDMILAGSSFGKIKAMNNELGKSIKNAKPSTPVEVLGLSTVPEAGDIFQVVKDEKLAVKLADQRKIVKKEEIDRSSQKVSLDNLFEKISEENLQTLNIIIKGDVHGSVEALTQSLSRISTDEIKVAIIHSGVGAVTENDVKLAVASGALLFGFNVRPDANAKKLASEEGLDIKLYRVIYEIIDDIKNAMSGLLTPEEKEVILGEAEVRQIIKVPKIGMIAGSYVTSGKITNSSHVRVIREGVIVFDGEVEALKRFKDEAKEVREGFECGISLKKYNDLKEGDVLEAYMFEQIARTID